MPNIPQHQLTSILNTLTSIDQRLTRIEAALRLNNDNAANNSHGNAEQQTSGGTVAAAGPNASVLAHPSLIAVGSGRAITSNVQQPPSAAVAQQLHPHPPLPPGASGTRITTSNSNTNTASGNINIIPLDPPPQGYTISSRATMQEELDAWTIPRGYSMRIAGAKVTGKRKVRWVCFRGGEARHHRPPVDEAVIRAAKAQGKRKPTTDRTSKKCGCLFKFEVIETSKGSDVWTLHYGPNEEHKKHNHGPTSEEDRVGDPRARKLPAEVGREVDAWLREGWLVSRVQQELRGMGYGSVLNTDLYNRKRLLKKEDAARMER